MKAFLVFRSPGAGDSTVVEADHFSIDHGVLIFFKHISPVPQAVPLYQPILALSGQNWARVESVEDMKDTHQKYSQQVGGEKLKQPRQIHAGDGV